MNEDVFNLDLRKFLKRFGVDAMRFVNSPERLTMRLRGINARVVGPGRIRTGDQVWKLRPDPNPNPEP